MLEYNQIVFHDERRNIVSAALSDKYGREWVEGRRRRGSPQELDWKGGTISLKISERRLASNDKEEIV